MILIEQCRIDPERECLIIEASIDNLSYYDDVYIESVIIDTEKTFSPNGPSNKPVFTEVFKADYSKVVTSDNSDTNTFVSKQSGAKRISLYLKAKDLKVSDLSSNIFFVYVTATGIPAISTPCGMDKCFVMGIAVNLRPVYNMAMGYIKELDSQCSMPKGFIDMILRLKAFDLSLRTGNYNTAFKQWERLIKNKINVPLNKGCGCNGIN